MKKILSAFLCGLLCCTFLCGLVACTDDKKAGDDAVVFYYYGVESTLKTEFEAKIEKFEKETGIKVKPIGITKDSYNASMMTKITSKKADIDLVYLDQPLIAQYSSNLMNLDEYIVDNAESDEPILSAENNVGFKFNKNAFTKGAWNTNVYEGSVYGLPLTITSSVLFYNVATIKEALGLATDEEAIAKVNAIKSWKDLESFAKEVDGLGSKYALFGGMGDGGYMGWYSQCFIGAAGGKLYDEQTKTVLPNDNGEITDAFNMIKYLYDNSPESLRNSVEGFKGTNTKPAGKIIFNLSQPSVVKDYELPYTKIGAIPFPGKTEEIGSVSNMGGENLVILKKSQKKEQALKLMKYLYSEDCQKFFQKCTSNFSAVSKYATAETFTTNKESSMYQMYDTVRQQLITAQVRPVVDGWLDINDNGIPKGINDFIKGEKSLEDAIAHIRTYANGVFAEE